MPGRVALLITSYLVITNISSYSLSVRLEVFTAMDVWLYTCKLLIIAALFEYAWILRDGQLSVACLCCQICNLPSVMLVRLSSKLGGFSRKFEIPRLFRQEMSSAWPA